jgi:hypothetical protein
MKSFPAILVVALFASLAGQAFARVGETEAQCNARYGKPLSQTDAPVGYGDKISIFRKAAFEIKAVFDGGRARSVTYSRIPKTGKSTEISPAEQVQLMRNNGGSNSWKKLKPTKSDDKYETADGKMRGRYNRGRNYLEVYEAAWSKGVSKMAKAGQQAKSRISADLRGL